MATVRCHCGRAQSGRNDSQRGGRSERAVAGTLLMTVEKASEVALENGELRLSLREGGAPNR